MARSSRANFGPKHLLEQPVKQLRHPRPSVGAGLREHEAPGGGPLAALLLRDLPFAHSGRDQGLGQPPQLPTKGAK